MSEKESCVVRIVNLDETFSSETLKKYILMMCQPNGDIKKIYLKRDNTINLFYGYVVFEHSYDAVKVAERLNGYVYLANKLEVELIGPNLNYRTFKKAREISHEHLKSGNRCEGNHFSIFCPLREVLTANKRFLNRYPLASGGDSIRRTVVKAKDIAPKTTVKADSASKAWRDGSSYANIYISNINFSTTESDLAKLVEPFGPKKKIFLGKDKETGLCKGFAFVNFKFRSDATEAISQLNGLSYNKRVLKAEWSRT